MKNSCCFIIVKNFFTPSLIDWLVKVSRPWVKIFQEACWSHKLCQLSTCLLAAGCDALDYDLNKLLEFCLPWSPGSAESVASCVQRILPSLPIYTCQKWEAWQVFNHSLITRVCLIQSQGTQNKARPSLSRISTIEV